MTIQLSLSSPRVAYKLLVILSFPVGAEPGDKIPLEGTRRKVELSPNHYTAQTCQKPGSLHESERERPSTSPSSSAPAPPTHPRRLPVVEGPPHVSKGLGQPSSVDPPPEEASEVPLHDGGTVVQDTEVRPHQTPAEPALDPHGRPVLGLPAAISLPGEERDGHEGAAQIWTII